VGGDANDTNQKGEPEIRSCEKPILTIKSIDVENHVELPKPTEILSTNELK
jgi:hypothetical protein